MAVTDIVHEVPLADEILDSHRHCARGDESGWAAYRAHVYRVINFARALSPTAPDLDDKLAIAAAFHDIGVFDTLDYLVPSITAQDRWLQRTGRQAWSEELAVVIAEHHRLTRYGADRPHAALAEAMRRAAFAFLDLEDEDPGIALREGNSDYEVARDIAPDLAGRLAQWGYAPGGGVDRWSAQVAHPLRAIRDATLGALGD